MHPNEKPQKTNRFYNSAFFLVLFACVVVRVVHVLYHPRCGVLVPHRLGNILAMLGFPLRLVYTISGEAVCTVGCQTPSQLRKRRNRIVGVRGFQSAVRRTPGKPELPDPQVWGVGNRLWVGREGLKNEVQNMPKSRF